MRTSSTRTVRRRLAGVTFLLVPAVLVWVSVSVYEKDFTDDATVTVRTGAVGNEMHDNADVKLRGVVIGQVRSIATDGDGARLTLAIDRDKLEQVPADVTAQMLPTTLFGARFVALVPPRIPTGSTLRAGAVIPQDRSSNAIELEQVLDNVLPLLTAVQPEKLSATLNAVSQALEGRGERLGETLTTLDGHLKKFNPQLPTLNADIKELVKVSTLYADAAPDVLDALTDATVTSSTLADQEARLAGLYGTTTAAAQDTTSFLRENKDNLIRLSAAGRPSSNSSPNTPSRSPARCAPWPASCPPWTRPSAREPTNRGCMCRSSPFPPRANTSPARTPRSTARAAGPPATRCRTSASTPRPPTPAGPPTSPRPRRTRAKTPTPGSDCPTRRRSPGSSTNWSPPR